MHRQLRHLRQSGNQAWKGRNLRHFVRNHAEGPNQHLDQNNAEARPRQAAVAENNLGATSNTAVHQKKK
jgi:hypothetical protein